jgi:hypothetical protein
MRSPRVLGLVALSIACVLASAVYITRNDGSEASPASAAPVGGIGEVQKGAIVFVNRDRERASQYGFTATADLVSPGRRKVESLPCSRIYFQAGRGLCLEAAGAIVKQRVTVLGKKLEPLGDVTLQGVPSRARVSPDGRYGAVTFFVYGHSYATPGSFSTQTTIIDLARRKKVVDVERFHVEKDGKEFDSPDFNFWGVTFARNSDKFYATLASRGTTYLVEGSIGARRARVLRTGVECPSLSPDGKRIAFKKRTGEGSQWRLHVMDVATLRDWPVAEARSVDDQAEWLDDEHVLYGVDNGVWSVPADGTGEPERLLDSADSPAVVRSA